MPVTLNEPLTNIQRSSEGLFSVADYLERSANFEDSIKRITYLTIALAGAVHSAKIRKKKPFNSMLGETYELVTKDFMLISEKV